MRHPGRPRSAAAHRALLRAVLDLLLAGQSLSGLSLEAVARKAGVGKATLYRRWPDKEALLLEAFASTHPPLPRLEGKSVREDLIRLLGYMAGLDARLTQRLFLARLAESARFPRLDRRYKTEVIEPRREAIRAVLRRGMATGELRPDLDVEQVHALMMAPLQFYLLVVGGQAKIPPGLPEFIVDTVLHGIAGPKLRGGGEQAP